MAKKTNETPEIQSLSLVSEDTTATEATTDTTDAAISIQDATAETFNTLPLILIEEGGNNNMYNAVNEAAQTVNQNANVLFATDRVRSNRSNACCGGWLSHDLGSGLFTLVNNNRCGCATFRIDFNANITAATTGALALAIKSNGEQVAGTEMDYTVATANTYQNVSAATVITVPCGASKTISIGNLTTTATLVKNANIIITKDC